MHLLHFLKTSIIMYVDGHIVAICISMVIQRLVLHLNQAIAIAGRNGVFFSISTLIWLKVMSILPYCTSKLVFWRLHCLYYYRLGGLYVIVPSHLQIGIFIDLLKLCRNHL